MEEAQAFNRLYNHAQHMKEKRLVMIEMNDKSQFDKLEELRQVNKVIKKSEKIL